MNTCISENVLQKQHQYDEKRRLLKIFEEYVRKMNLEVQTRYTEGLVF